MSSEFQRRKYARLFQFFDSNHDGVLTVEDYLQIAEHLAQERGWSKGMRAYDQLHKTFADHWEQVRKFADINKNNEIGLPEWSLTQPLSLLIRICIRRG